MVLQLHVTCGVEEVGPRWGDLSVCFCAEDFAALLEK
jgi:hypothetical protein